MDGKFCRGMEIREIVKYGHKLTEILADTNTHPLKNGTNFFLNRCGKKGFFRRIQFCSSTSRRFSRRNGCNRSAVGGYDMVDMLVRYTARGTAPPQHLHVCAAPQASRSPLLCLLSFVRLFCTTARARHTRRRYLRVLSRLHCWRIYNTCRCCA